MTIGYRLIEGRSEDAQGDCKEACLDGLALKAISAFATGNETGFVENLPDIMLNEGFDAAVGNAIESLSRLHTELDQIELGKALMREASLQVFPGGLDESVGWLEQSELVAFPVIGLRSEIMSDWKSGRLADDIIERVASSGIRGEASQLVLVPVTLGLETASLMSAGRMARLVRLCSLANEAGIELDRETASAVLAVNEESDVGTEEIETRMVLAVEISKVSEDDDLPRSILANDHQSLEQAWLSIEKGHGELSVDIMPPSDFAAAAVRMAVGRIETLLRHEAECRKEDSERFEVLQIALKDETLWISARNGRRMFGPIDCPARIATFEFEYFHRYLAGMSRRLVVLH